MNKKFVTLLSVAVLSIVASGVYADELTLGGSVASNGHNSGLVVSEQPTETQPSASVEHSATELGKESDKEETGDHTGVVVEPTTPSEQPKEDKPSDDLGKDTDKNQEHDNTGVVVEPTTPSEKPKEEQPKADTQKEDDSKVQEDKKKAEGNVGVKESDDPKPLNVTKEEIQEKPIETNTGYKVVSTSQGKVVVETSEGGYAEKEPYEVGAVRQKDGTIALKDKEGQLKVLPNTGTASTIFTTIWGIVGLIATVLGKRKLN
jgi:gram positive anchor domain protein